MEPNEKEERPLGFGVIAGYYSILLVLWFTAHLILYPFLEINLSLVWRELFEDIFKMTVWVGAAVFLIRRYQSQLEIDLKEMVKPEQVLKVSLPFVFLFLLYLLLGEYVMEGTITINKVSYIELIGSVPVAGIAEEFVFRGFILNALAVKMKHWQANIITAVLFLVIHFPIWLHNGILQSNFFSGAFLLIMGLSVIFSWLFLKSRTIYVPILLHMCWNLLVAFIS